MAEATLGGGAGPRRRLQALRYAARTYKLSDRPVLGPAFFAASRLLAPGEWLRRVRAVPPGKPNIARADGYLIADYSGNPAVMAGIAQAREIAADVDWEARARAAQKPFLIAHPVEPVESLLGLAQELAGPAARYIGSLPVLHAIQIWFSPNVENHPGRSQDFHLDGVDRRQVKCFLPLEEISTENGPLTLLPASLSERIYRRLSAEGHVGQRTQKVADSVIERHFDPADKVEVVGRPGTVGMVDTCRCYHFGSRKASRPRLLLMLQFASAFSIEMPLWGRRHGGDPVFGARSLLYRSRRGAAPALDE